MKKGKEIMQHFQAVSNSHIFWHDQSLYRCKRQQQDYFHSNSQGGFVSSIIFSIFKKSSEVTLICFWPVFFLVAVIIHTHNIRASFFPNTEPIGIIMALSYANRWRFKSKAQWPIAKKYGSREGEVFLWTFAPFISLQRSPNCPSRPHTYSVHV